jgi:hypothetical protein
VFDAAHMRSIDKKIGRLKARRRNIKILKGLLLMKTSLRKISISIIALAMMTIAALPLNASAGDLSRTYSGQFTTAWSLTASSGAASLTYGYNTVAINEDFAWANHNTAEHFASLTNGSGIHNGPVKPAGTVSTIEVTHSGSSVTYHCYW